MFQQIIYWDLQIQKQIYQKNKGVKNDIIRYCIR